MKAFEIQDASISEQAASEQEKKETAPSGSSGPMYRSLGYLVVLSVSAAMGSVVFGYNQAVYGTLYHYQITQEFNVEDGSSDYVYYASMFSFVHGIGTIIGSGCANFIIDNFGRRRSFILLDILGILAQLLYQIPNLKLTLTARCLVGFFVGLTPQL